MCSTEAPRHAKAVELGRYVLAPIFKLREISVETAEKYQLLAKPLTTTDKFKER